MTVSRNIGGQELVVSYVPAGHYVGEMALIGDAPRNATIRAAVATDTIWLDGATFRSMLDEDPTLKQRVEERLMSRLVENEEMAAQPDAGNVVQFLVEQGIGEGSGVRHDPPGVVLEILCRGFLQGYGDGRGRVVVRSALESGEDGPVEVTREFFLA